MKTILKEYSHIFIPLCFHEILIKNPENLPLTKVVLMDKLCADSYVATVVTMQESAQHLSIKTTLPLTLQISIGWLYVVTSVIPLALKGFYL